MLFSLRRWWPKKKLPEVVIHDPDAERPHDLDDPFFDRTIQERVAKVIADAAQKK
jgi:hypothetical protein